MQYPSGFTARYEYTPNQGYLQYFRDHATNSALWTATTRNAQGQYTEAALSNGISIKRNFDPQTGRISTIKAGVLDSIANYSYAFDTVGNLTSRSDATQSLTETFQYDTLNRLTHATIGTTTRITTYNSVGNILQKTRAGSAKINSYVYPLAGQPQPYSVSQINGEVNLGGSPTYTYDNNGNLLTGADRTLTWTSFNKVDTIVQSPFNPPDTTVAFTYDAEQERLKETVDSTTVKYFNDPISGLSAEHHSTGGGTWHDYLIADGERFGLRIKPPTPAAVSWQLYVPDHLGSVAVVTDGAGAVVQRLSYDAWGRRRQPNGTEVYAGTNLAAPTSRGYTDHEHIDDIGLINMNARLYDPEIGRFLSPDSIVPNVFRSQALNRYSYVSNNPASYTDPTGHACAEAVSCGIQVAVQVWGWFKVWHVDKSDAEPPRHHSPGLASVNENLRGTAPLYNVSAESPLADGNTAMGGAKYASGASSEAFDYTFTEGMSWVDKTHLILNGASILLDASVIGSVVSWIPDVLDAGVSVYEGDWTGAGMSVGAVIPGLGVGANATKMARVGAEVAERTVGGVIKAPKIISGIPNLRATRPKTPVQGGGALRKRWKDADGNIYEWDSRHGTLEKYNKRGKHLGEFDPSTGAQMKPADPTRRVEP